MNRVLCWVLALGVGAAVWFWVGAWWLLAGIVGSVLLLFGVWVWSIYDRVKHCPRGEMVMCQRHGPIFEKDCIRFLDTSYCSKCFGENLRKAEQVGISDYMRRNYPGKVQ